MKTFLIVPAIVADSFFTGFCLYQMFHIGFTPEHTWILWWAASFVFLNEFGNDVVRLVEPHERP